MLGSRCVSTDPGHRVSIDGGVLVSDQDEVEAAGVARARAVGMFRYQLIRDAADPGLTSRQRGRMVRGLAAVEHTDPSGQQVRYSRDHLDRWIRAWRRGG